MIVGYWNIQRVANPHAKDKAVDRFTFADACITDWISRRRVAPSILFLSEVSQKGGEFANFLTQKHSGKGYTARFYPVPDKNGNPSPCSFLVMGLAPYINSGAKLIGGSTKRPAVMVRIGNYSVSGVHIIAVAKAKALEEMSDFCTEMAHYDSVIVGDMNYPLEDLRASKQDMKYFIDLRYKVTPPDMQRTFKPKGQSNLILDYAWTKKNIPTVAVPPKKQYSEWNLIDHAPIGYIIK